MIYHININSHRHTNGKGLHLSMWWYTVCDENFLLKKANISRIYKKSSCSLFLDKANFGGECNYILSKKFQLKTVLMKQTTVLRDSNIFFWKKVILGHLNINFLRNEFKKMENRKLNTFRSSHFSMNGCRMFRPDKYYFGGGLCMYVEESNACKQLNFHK